MEVARIVHSVYQQQASIKKELFLAQVLAVIMFLLAEDLMPLIG